MDYQKIYNNLITSRKALDRQRYKKSNIKYIYYEAHHIVPRCMGGEGECHQWKTHPNIVLLTAREHFLAHWLLHRIYPEHSGLGLAFYRVCFVNGSNKEKQFQFTPSSRAYEEARSVSSKTISKIHTGHLTSKQTRNKISQANKGRKYSEEQKRIMKETRKKKPLLFEYLCYKHKTGEFIGRYKTSAEIKEKLNVSNVFEFFSTNRVSLKGYVFFQVPVGGNVSQEEINKKVEAERKPRKMSAETKKQVRKTWNKNRAMGIHINTKGRPAWNKGLKGVVKQSQSHRDKVSESNKNYSKGTIIAYKYPSMEFVGKYFNSVQAEKELGVKSGYIRHSIIFNRYVNRCKGYFFKREPKQLI